MNCDLSNLKPHRVHAPKIVDLNPPKSCQLVIDDKVPPELKGHSIDCKWEGYVSPHVCGCK